MILKKQARHSFLSAFLLLALAQAAVANDYRDARAELVEAYRAEDFRAMQYAAQKALVARPEYPGALFNLALAYTLNERPHDALRMLQRLADKRIDFGVAAMDEFMPLRDLDGWGDYLGTLEAINRPVGSAEVVASWPDGSFVPEGIGADASGHLYLGSVRHGAIARLGDNPALVLDDGDNWSVFGMRFHPDGSLWFASAAVPQFVGVDADAGQTGLFRLDVDTGTLTKTALLPAYEPDQVLGDLIIADDNTIYTSDSLTGALYRYHIDSNEFEVLVQRGELGSPQGLVLDETGGNLYVADYIGGLFRVSTSDGSLVRLEVPAEISDFGIDGLYRAGGELIAVQNGIRPNRVVALQLSESGLAITGSRLLASSLQEFDEPTLGFVDADDFLFVANSHWNRFDANHDLPDGLSGPLVLKLSLKP